MNNEEVGLDDFLRQIVPNIKDTGAKAGSINEQNIRRRQLLFRRQGGLCAYCDRPLESAMDGVCDHVRPKSKGGTDGIHNRALVCKPCDFLKGSVSTYAEGKRYAEELKKFFDKLHEKGILK